MFAGHAPIATPEKKRCTCGYETEYRCRIHAGRPAHHFSYGVVMCHECLEYVYSLERTGLPHSAAVEKLLERQFVLCPGCAHEMALVEASQREADAFVAALLTSDQFMPEALREVERLLEVQ